MDDHSVDYWVRQIRIGTWIAVLVTSIGEVRIGLNWPAGERWWLGPVAGAVLLQASALRLPWARLVRRNAVRKWLLLWWLGELPVLVLFGLNDDRGPMLYLPGAALLLITAAALFSPLVVVGLGATAVAGYCVLLPVQAATDLSTTIVLVAMMTCVVGLTAVNSQSRRRLNRRRHAAEAGLQHQAFTDPLTGLPNRIRFRERLGLAVAGNEGSPVTLLLLDLDDFKLVNDNLGHSAGDELLATIADRLRAQVRPGDLLARLGGDEFAILMAELDPEDAAALAVRLLAVVREPIRLASREVVCTLSVGIATAGDEVTAEQLLGNADLAMYAAKRAGRNAYAIFDPTMIISVLEEAQQRADLEHALEHDEFLVLYQPVVEIHSQRLIGVEALVRWQHPRDGLLGPHHFIADAEANGLIVPLGRWVLRQATAQLARWRTESPAAAGLKMNVNLSARQFQYAGLVDDVAAAIADAGIDPASLTLEITESMLMADIESAIQTLHALRWLGVRLAIDDFGTGYSSLSYLKKLPVDIIKIDKTFVDQVDRDADDVALIDAVVGLGQALKMQTVAEGIETDGQWDMLRRIGIDHGQGYLFGRPSRPEDIHVLMNAPADPALEPVRDGLPGRG